MATPLKIQIIVDDKGSVKIRQVGTEAEKAGHKGEKAFRRTGKSLDEMNRKTAKAHSRLLKMAGAAVSFGVLYLAIRKVTREISEFVELAGKQEAVEKRVEAVLKATAQAAGYNLTQLKAMAAGMQQLTTVGDEVILSGQAILLTFKQIRGEGFERATMAALDMAEVMEGDLKGSIVMIGKALNDPIANLSAMTRAGVQFTAGQKDMIKQLWESGKEMEAQNIILTELENQFGGTAAAARETFKGMSDAAGNAYGDMYEQLGYIVTKNSFFVEGLKIAEEEFIRWGGIIKDNEEALQSFVKNGVLVFGDALLAVLYVMKAVHEGWLGIKLVVTTTLNFLGIGVAGLFKSLALLLKPLELIYDALVAMGVVNWNPITAGIGAVQEALDLFAASSGDVVDDVLKDIEATDRTYNTVIKTLENLRDRLKDVKTGSAELGKSQKQLRKEVEGLGKALKEFDKQIAASELAQKKDLFRQLKIELYGYHDAVLAGHNEEVEKEIELRKNAIEQQFNMIKEMYDDMAELYSRDFEYEVSLMEEKAELYKKAGIDQVKIQEWVNYKLRELLKEQLIEQGGFFGGMASYLMDMQDDWRTAMQQAGQLGYDTFESIGDAFEESLVLSMKNDFNDIGDLWGNLLDDMLDSFIKLVAALIKQWVLSGIANLAISVTGGAGGGVIGIGGGPTGTGTGGGFGSLWDWLGIAESGYELSSGNSLLGSLYNSVFGASYGSVTGAGYAGGAGSAWASAPAMSEFSGAAYGAAAVPEVGSAGAGGAMSVSASAGIAAAVVAAIMLITAIFEHNMAAGPSKLMTETALGTSADPDKLITGNMTKSFLSGGIWEEEDWKKATENVAGMVADTLDVYNVMFANLGEESQAALKEEFSKLDLENMELYFSQSASEGAPVTGQIIMNSINEIAASEWAAIAKELQSKSLGEFGIGRLPELTDVMKESIVGTIEENGKLTGEALADIMGISFDALLGAFGAINNTDNLQPFIDSINKMYAEGYDVISARANNTIPEAFQQVFGEYFEEYIEESLTNIKGKEVFAFMTDEIQEAIEGMTLESFLSDIQGFTDAFTKNVFQVERAGKIWEALNAFVGRASDEVTAYEVAATKAQIQITAYTQMMAQFGEKLTAEEIAAKTKEVMAALTGGIDDLEAATKPLGQMGQLYAALNGQFDAYVAMLVKSGVAIEKLTDIEKLRFEATERLLNEYKIALGLFGEDYLQKLKLEEIADKYKQFGLSFQEMLDWFKDASLADIQAIAESLGRDWSEIADDMGFLAQVLKALGEAATIAANDFAALRESITNTLANFGAGATQDPASLMALITGIRSTPMSEMTGPMLQEMADLLVQWYAASAAQLEEEARAAAEQIRLLEQVADRMAALIDQIDSTIMSIKTGPLNVSLPTQIAQEIAVDYEAAYAAAQTGGTAEIQKYLSIAQTHLGTYQAAHKSGQQYQDEYARVMGHMESVRGSLGAGDYNAQLLAELQSGNADIHADLSGIQATFSEFEGWILNALQTLEDLNLIININWGEWTGDQTEALRMLLTLVEVYGWDHTYTLKFLAEVPLDIFEDLNDLASMAGWIADQSGGWNSTATISFLKNVAANWEFENIEQILSSAGFVAQQAGSWAADASVTFIATLMDRFGTPIADMPYWLDQMGVGDQIPDVMAKLILELYGGAVPITDIDAYLTSLGITDTALRRSIEVQLVFNFGVSGDMDLAQIADWAYAKIVSALLLDVGDPQKYALLGQVQSLSTMFGVFDAFNLGRRIGELSPLAQGAGWTGDTAGPAAEALWAQDMGYTSWAGGGIATKPTWGVFGDAGPEAFLRLSDNTYVPTQFLNGGSTQAGSVNRDEEISLLREQNDMLAQLVAQNGRPIELGGAPLDRYVDGRSDNVRRLAERRSLGPRRMF